MDYKSLMGFGNKKKISNKKPEPKVNKILKSIKEEFGYKDTLKEVGASAEYRKYIKNIDKTRNDLGKATLTFYELLRKKGIDDEAADLLDDYKNGVIKFGLKFKKLVRKLM
tara:strand:+ start:59 stop:391 length:333 start_codon:yes stop_codon:yes gene_type:complete